MHEAVTAAMPTSVKTLHFSWNIILSCIENAVFMWVQEHVFLDSNVIWEKAEPFYDNLKQRKGDRSKLENLMPAKNGLIVLEKSLALKNNVNWRSSFCQLRGSKAFRDVIKQVVEGKGSPPEQVFNAN